VRNNPQARIAYLERELEWANLKIKVLEERLRQRRIQMLGPRARTLTDLQLELLEEEPSVSAQEVEAEAQSEPPAAKPARERKRHPGRRQLPENLRGWKRSSVARSMPSTARRAGTKQR